MPTQHNTKTASLLALALLLLGIDTENFNDDISQTLVWLDLPDTISGNRGIFSDDPSSCRKPEMASSVIKQ